MTPTKPLVCLAWLTLHFSAHAASLSETFNLGTQFGQNRNAAARDRINSGTAIQTVPGYTTTAPPTSYFGGADLGTPAASTIAHCNATPQDPRCQAIRFTQTNPGQRPSFTIAPNDPLLIRAQTITGDPASIAGNLAGTYSACSTQTVTSPDIYTQHLCNEYRFLEQHTCTKTLTVTVSDTGLSCNVGDYVTPVPRIMFIRPYVFVGTICAEDIRFKWFWGYSECNGTNDTIYHTSVVPSPEYQRQMVSLGCGGVYYVEGACPNGHCSYTVGLPNVMPICLQPRGEDCDLWEYADLPLAAFNFQRAVRTYNIQDHWDNACATWEARLP